MTGDACSELEVATDEALTAEAGTEAANERDGRKDVCTWLGFARLINEDCAVCEAMAVVGVEGAGVAVAIKEGLEVADMLW